MSLLLAASQSHREKIFTKCEYQYHEFTQISETVNETDRNFELLYFHKDGKILILQYFGQLGVSVPADMPSADQILSSTVLSLHLSWTFFILDFSQIPLRLTIFPVVKLFAFKDDQVSKWEVTQAHEKHS